MFSSERLLTIQWYTIGSFIQIIASEIHIRENQILHLWREKNYNHKKVIRIFGLLHMNRRIGVGAGWLIETIYPSYDYVGFIFHSPRKMSDYVYIKQLNLSRGNIIIKHWIQRQYEQHSKYYLKLLSFFRLWKNINFGEHFLRVFGCDARFRKVNQRCDR